VVHHFFPLVALGWCVYLRQLVPFVKSKRQVLIAVARKLEIDAGPEFRLAAPSCNL
jgi:hypothetical protein